MDHNLHPINPSPHGFYHYARYSSSTKTYFQHPSTESLLLSISPYSQLSLRRQRASSFSYSNTKPSSSITNNNHLRVASFSTPPLNSLETFQKPISLDKAAVSSNESLPSANNKNYKLESNNNNSYSQNELLCKSANNKVKRYSSNPDLVLEYTTGNRRNIQFTKTTPLSIYNTNSSSSSSLLNETSFVPVSPTLSISSSQATSSESSPLPNKQQGQFSPQHDSLNYKDNSENDYNTSSSNTSISTSSPPEKSHIEDSSSAFHSINQHLFFHSDSFTPKPQYKLHNQQPQKPYHRQETQMRNSTFPNTSNDLLESSTYASSTPKSEFANPKFLIDSFSQLNDSNFAHVHSSDTTPNFSNSHDYQEIAISGNNNINLLSPPKFTTDPPDSPISISSILNEYASPSALSLSLESEDQFSNNILNKTATNSQATLESSNVTDPNGHLPNSRISQTYQSYPNTAPIKALFNENTQNANLVIKLNDVLNEYNATKDDLTYSELQSGIKKSRKHHKKSHTKKSQKHSNNSESSSKRAFGESDTIKHEISLEDHTYVKNNICTLKKKPISFHQSSTLNPTETGILETSSSVGNGSNGDQSLANCNLNNDFEALNNALEAVLIHKKPHNTIYYDAY